MTYTQTKQIAQARLKLKALTKLNRLLATQTNRWLDRYAKNRVKLNRVRDRLILLTANANRK
jgi:hypothetical protein